MISELAKESFNIDNIECWFEVMFKCTEIPSVNSAHGINTKTKVVFDQPWLVQFKREIADQLTLVDPVKNCPWITPSAFYFIAIKFIMKTQFYNRDTDNMIKYLQDRVAEACHINDSHILEVHAWKNFLPGDNEFILVRFGISNYNYKQFMDN